MPYKNRSAVVQVQGVKDDGIAALFLGIHNAADALRRKEYCEAFMLRDAEQRSLISIMPVGSYRQSS